MQLGHRDYKGCRIELVSREATESPELLVDGESVSYGKLPSGQYFLHAYAYDWVDDLTKLAERWIDYRAKAERIRGAGIN
jgi:hypothetical protein